MQSFLKEAFLGFLLTAGLAAAALFLYHADLLTPGR